MKSLNQSISLCLHVVSFLKVEQPAEAGPQPAVQVRFHRNFIFRKFLSLKGEGGEEDGDNKAYFKILLWRLLMIFTWNSKKGDNVVGKRMYWNYGC